MKIEESENFDVHRDGRFETKYPIILKAMNNKIYDEATAYLGKISHHTKWINGQAHYFVNGEGTQIARTDEQRKTIELTDMVNSEIVSSIKHILETEGRNC